MRRVVLYIVCLMAVVQVSAKVDSLAVEPHRDALAHWEVGNKAYVDGDYAKAVEEYSAIVEGGDYYYCDINRITYYTADNEIGECMFAHCDNPANITLPNKLSLIQSEAFSGCGFTSIATGDGVAEIGSYAFAYCDQLTSVSIGDNVKTIGNHAFYDCRNLNSVSIGTGVTKIEHRAFADCENIRSVHIKDLSAWCKIDFELLKSEYYAEWADPLYNSDLYLNGEKLENLVIPEDVTEIRPYAFSGCSSITSITIGNQVTKIGEYGFYGCSSLTLLAIGDGVTEINRGAFMSCYSLTDIKIGKGVTKIGASAFYPCKEGAAFYSYAPTPPSIETFGNYTTFYKYGGMTLYVPTRYLQSYKGSHWADVFTKIIEID